MKFEYWNAIKTSTWFKLLVATAVSYVLYLLAGFMLPILLAIGLAFGLYPLVNMITQVRVAHGMIKLSRAVAIVLALIGFLIFLCIAIGFIILPLFGQMNDLLVKLPALAAKSNIQDLDTMLQDPSKIPMLPSSFEMLTDGMINWAMGLVSGILRNLLRSSLEIVSNLIGLIIVPFLAFYFLKDWRDLRSMFINLFNYDVQDRVAQVVDNIGRTLSSYVRGLVKLSLISGFVITIGTAFLGIDFPLVLGFWAILAETVPVVGPI
ncbi:MAG: AI-2E family transporter, partial [Phascolarctobacterium sp.]|nr:AI-2E family transporter [Phascolarctobacterium sp.]